MEKLFRLLFLPLGCTLIFYIFMHARGFPFWLYPAMFLILLVAGYFWDRVLPADKDKRRSTALTISTVAAIVLLVILAVIVTL